MTSLNDLCADLLESGQDIVTATVISKKGSAPRTAGAKMVVCRDKSIHGTVGGGLLEGQVRERAAELFEARMSAIVTVELTGTDYKSTEMICGGRVEVFLDFVSATDPKNLTIFQTLKRAQASEQPALQITELPVDTVGHTQLSRYVLVNAQADEKSVLPEVWSDVARRELSVTLKHGHTEVRDLDGRQYLLEPTHTSGTVYLFGAGHVAQQVARMAKCVDFGVVVLDDRPEFANEQQFPDANVISVIDSFKRCMTGLHIDKDAYLVIVTRGHQHDLDVLRQALQTDAGYIGLISSTRKRKLLYEALVNLGVSDAQLARVYSPIGIPISAETPAEIAVSIVAELIQVRSEVIYG